MTICLHLRADITNLVDSPVLIVYTIRTSTLSMF